MHRKWTPKEKLEVVLEGMKDENGIAAICRNRGISTTQYYQWRNKLLGSAEIIFQRSNNKPDIKEERLIQDMGRMKSVIAEITAENLELKKGFIT